MNAVTRDFISYASPLGPMGLVIQETARRFRVSYPEITGISRVAKFVRPRWAAMWVCRKHIGASYPKIGLAFNRDHTSVLYAVGMFEESATIHEMETATEIARRAGVLKGEE